MTTQKMNSPDGSEEVLRRQRRLKKFSAAARDRIISDPVNDRALLSRSSSGSVDALLNSSKARTQLLLHLKQGAVDDSQLEHGLRKLREVIVSLYELNKEDSVFLQQTKDVYKMSYDYYFARRDYGKLGNLVLKFMYTKLSSTASTEYADLYLLHVSHIERDLGKSLLLMKRRKSIDKQTSKLLRLSLIFNCQTESPSEWFKLLAEISENSLLYQFLRHSQAYKEIERRCFETIRKSYNQLSVDFLLQHWFHSSLSHSELLKQYPITTSPSGHQIIQFKRPKR